MGGQNFEIYIFFWRGGGGVVRWGGTLQTIFRVRQFGRLFLGMSFLTGIFLGVSFQNKAVYNVPLMYSLIKKNSSFTIYASNRLEPIKILYKFNNSVAFLSASLVAVYSLGICLCIATLTGLTGIFWGMPKILGILGVKNQGQK